MEVIQVKVAALRPHPQNTRDPKEDVGELAASIKAHGILQPLVVHGQGKGYEVLVGHRRLAAAKVLGLELVPAIQVKAEEAAALEILVTDNAHHSPPDPLREAEAVAALMKGGTWSVRDVADRLGKSVRWVAQRRAMADLDPKIVDRWRAGKGRLREWTPAMLQCLAQLPPEAQGQVADLGWPRHLEDVEREVEARLRTLAKAPWGLDDAQLVPKAGACSACPKTSLSRPGLFDDGEPGQDAKKGKCLDSACWAGKLKAFRDGRLATLRAEHPGLVLMHGGYGSGAEDLADEDSDDKGIDGKVLSSHDVKRCGKDAKGAVPALIVAGKGVGSMTWIQPYAWGGGAAEDLRRAAKKEAGEPVGEKKPPTLKERQESLEARRQAFVVDSIRTHIVEDVKAPHARIVSALLCAYGVEGQEVDCPYTHGAGTTRKKVYAEVDGDRRANWPDFATRVWPGVVARIEQALNRILPARLEAQHEEALWLCEVLGVDPKPFRAEAEQEIQPSKALQAQLAAAKGRSKK